MGVETVQVPNLADMASSLKDINRALVQIVNALGATVVSPGGNNTFTGQNAFTQAVKLAPFTVATLPAVTAADAGQIAFASDARNTGQGGGAGTGALVVVDNTGAWAIVGTGVAPTA